MFVFVFFLKIALGALKSIDRHKNLFLFLLILVIVIVVVRLSANQFTLTCIVGQRWYV